MPAGKKILEETKQMIAQDYLAGMKQSKIAEKYDISAAAVSMLLSRMKMSELKEKEPVPAATETSSDVVKDDNTLHSNNSKILSVCQENLDRAAKDLLGIYERMSPEEQRAWDLGEVFGSISRALGEFV